MSDICIKCPQFHHDGTKFDIAWEGKDIKNTHDWNNDNPCECGLETLDGGQAFYLPLFDFWQVYYSTATLYPELFYFIFEQNS